MREFIKKLIKNKIVRFVLVGGCSTIIDFIIYMLLSLRINITFAKGVSMICSSVFSYIANKNFTFLNKKKTNVAYLMKFYIVFMANFVANLGANRLVYAMTESKIVAFILATLCGTMINYLGQRFIVFGKR